MSVVTRSLATVCGLLVVLATLTALVGAQTPKLSVKTKHGLSVEEQRKAQVERLAQQYDLKKYTLTRDIMIDREAENHSMPVLTLNRRFLDDDDLPLSAYVHEQGHWVLVERHRQDNQPMLADLVRTFPNLDIQPPAGDGERASSYFHIVVGLLEWQAMEALVGVDRARRVIEWKRGDHYTAIYAIVITRRRDVETILNRYGVRW